MLEEIKQALTRIEAEENARVLFACESGSRAWGFASKDSDWDVRFIYVRPTDWYLSIEDGRDVIERPIVNDLDLSGWDLPKALRLFRKSNPPMLEWLSSPIVYRDEYGLAGRLRELGKRWFNPVSGVHHYLNMARGNYREYLRGESVRVKKYLYVLRPLLAARWIQAGHGAPPTEFSILVERCAPEPGVEQAIRELVERKAGGEELDEGPQIPPLTGYIESELDYWEDAPRMEPAAQPTIEELDQLFLETLRKVWE